MGLIRLHDVSFAAVHERDQKTKYLASVYYKVAPLFLHLIYYHDIFIGVKAELRHNHRYLL